MEIRRAEEADVSATIAIFMEAGSDMVARYQPEQAATFPGPDPARFVPLWRHVLRSGAMFLAQDPDPVGFSAAIVRDGVWFLSLLWVRPERQGEGIGGALLDAALDWGHGASTFSVVASPDPTAQALYLRRSMFPIWWQQEWVGAGLETPSMPDPIDDLSPEDQPWVDELERRVRGVARPEDHRFWLARARGLALRRGGEPVGYVYAWPGGRIGPGAADEAADLPILLQAARAATGLGSLALIVPSTNRVLLNEMARLRCRLIGTNAFMASRPMPDAATYLSSGGALA